MAEENQGNPEEQNVFDPFDAPIPGASLTSDPDNRAPYETPPQITDPQAAIEEIFFRMVEDPENLDNMLDLMRDDVPVEDITQVLLFKGFADGLWTPDMVLNLIEPTIYILLNLAEYAGIEPVLYPEDDMDELDAYDTEDTRAGDIRKLVAGETKETLSEMQGDVSQLPTPTVVPKSLQERIMSKVSKEGERDV